MTATVAFRETADHYQVSFRYNPRLVEAIKATVPPGSRRWVPQQKHWLVDLWAAPELAEVLRDAGYRVIGLQVHRDLTDWAVGLLTAMGTPGTSGRRVQSGGQGGSSRRRHR